jgi:hypothetical protein
MKERYERQDFGGVVIDHSWVPKLISYLWMEEISAVDQSAQGE